MGLAYLFAAGEIAQRRDSRFSAATVEGSVIAAAEVTAKKPMVQGTEKVTLSQQQLLLIVLVWLAAIWLPAIAIRLPPTDHAYFQDMLGTSSFTLAVTVIIKNKK